MNQLKQLIKEFRKTLSDEDADLETMCIEELPDLLDAVETLVEDYANLQALYEEEINLAHHQRGRKLFINDEKIIQKQRRELRAINSAGYNALKSILSENIGPTEVEKIIRTSEDRARKSLQLAEEKVRE